MILYHAQGYIIVSLGMIMNGECGGIQDGYWSILKYYYRMFSFCRKIRDAMIWDTIILMLRNKIVTIFLLYISKVTESFAARNT